MCRYDDDDYEWYVGAVNPASVEAQPMRCEDCGRMIDAGEPHTRYTAEAHESNEDWPLRWTAYWPRGWSAETRYKVDLGLQESDDETIWAFEALGFELVDDHDERDAPPPEFHHQCAQCYIANGWLVAVCDQHVVMVTVMDLDEHMHDYTPEQLGPEFCALARMAARQWRHNWGQLADPTTVKILTDRAIEHAETVGLHPQ